MKSEMNKKELAVKWALSAFPTIWMVEKGDNGIWNLRFSLTMNSKLVNSAINRIHLHECNILATSEL